MALLLYKGNFRIFLSVKGFLSDQNNLQQIQEQYAVRSINHVNRYIKCLHILNFCVIIFFGVISITALKYSLKIDQYIISSVFILMLLSFSAQIFGTIYFCQKVIVRIKKWYKII